MNDAWSYCLGKIKYFNYYKSWNNTIHFSVRVICIKKKKSILCGRALQRPFSFLRNKYFKGFLSLMIELLWSFTCLQAIEKMCLWSTVSLMRTIAFSDEPWKVISVLTPGILSSVSFLGLCLDLLIKYYYHNLYYIISHIKAYCDQLLLDH